jgi:hypothetical protein
VVAREILANIGVIVDLKPLKELDKSVDQAKKSLVLLGRVGAGFGAAQGAFKLVQMASHATETMNILRTTFAENSDAVVQWSKTIGKEMGRSEFTMQEMVSKFGAFLEPQFKGNLPLITDMSEQLSQLAIDLGSFYDMSDKDAIMNLFSGMSGETEAVRKFGIDISDSALEAFNKANGDPRTMRALNLREKTLLRFKKIMLDTEKAQGDAVKTAGEWAGQLKRFQDRLKTVGVTLGRRILPLAMKLLNAINASISFVEKHQEAIEAMAIAAGALVASLVVNDVVKSWHELNGAMHIALELIKMNRLAIAGMAVQAGLVALAFFAIEDVLSAFAGKKSIFNDVLEHFTGWSNSIGAVEVGLRVIKGYLMELPKHAANAAIELGKMIPSLGPIIQLLEASGVIKKHKTTDWMDVEAKRGVQMKGNQEAALLRGGEAAHQDFVANRPAHMSPEDASLEFMRRRELVVQRNIKAGALGAGGDKGFQLTEEDQLQGYVPADYQQALTEAATGKQADTSLAGTLRGRTTNVSLNVNLNIDKATATKEEMANTVRETVGPELDKLMRQTLAAESEEH